MAGEAALSEALARVEHKLDLILEAFATIIGPGKRGTYMLTPVGDSQHVCPVCTQPVSYQVDITNKLIARKCGCGTGLQAPIDLGAFAPPVLGPRMENSDGSSSQQEDGSNPRGGKRGGRR